jgi:V8-like Glu-specific endopeptidase
MFQVAWPGDQHVNGLACRINGYSGDLDPTGCTQYTRHGPVQLSNTREFVSYQMSTYAGDSGAPVYHQPANRPWWNIIAVHVTGVPDTGQNDGLNFGPALSGAALDWVTQRI